MQAITGETLGQIAAKDISRTEVFKKYGLDFCCGGKKTVEEACAEKGLNADEIEQELRLPVKGGTARPLPFDEWPLDFLADYIVNTHHRYTRKMLPDIMNSALKVMSVHGKIHPELSRIMRLVEDINSEMSGHMIKEERVLFPYIKELEAAIKNHQRARVPLFGTVRNPILMMEAEHEMVGKNLEEIRALSNNYELPGDACASYRLLYTTLADFEDDLHIHVHLENNILFPKALQSENSYNSRKPAENTILFANDNQVTPN